VQEESYIKIKHFLLIALFITKMIETRMNYKHENPVRARIVELSEDYL